MNGLVACIACGRTVADGAVIDGAGWCEVCRVEEET